MMLSFVVLFFRIFPWVLAVFEIQPYHFYKVIELLIRAEENFSRDVIKHLNSVSKIGGHDAIVFEYL